MQKFEETEIGGPAFSMYGIGSLTGFVGGWVGDRLRRYGLIAALVIMASDGYLMFNSVQSMAGQMVLSFIFGAMLSGFLFPRFLAVGGGGGPRLQGSAAALFLGAEAPGEILGTHK